MTTITIEPIKTIKRIFNTIPIRLRDYAYAYIGQCLENPRIEIPLELVANLNDDQLETIKALGSLCYIFRKDLEK